MTSDDPIAKTRRYFDAAYPGARAERLSPIQEYVFERIAAVIPVGRADQNAVDLGCHWGRYTRYLARTYGTVWGVDVAATALASAPGLSNVQYRVMDLDHEGASFEFAGRVDLFLAVGLFEVLGDPAGLCRRLAVAAERGTRVVIVSPNRASIHYWAFRFVVWIARNVLRRRRTFIYHNGTQIDDLVGWLRDAGFTAAGRGAIVGVPPAIVDRLPHRVQRLLLPLDRIVLRVLGGSYQWALVEKES